MYRGLHIAESSGVVGNVATSVVSFGSGAGLAEAMPGSSMYRAEDALHKAEKQQSD